MNTNMRTIYTIGASLIFLRLNTFLYVKLKLYIRCLKVRLQTTTKTCTSWNWSKQSKHHPTQTILAHKALRDQIKLSGVQNAYLCCCRFCPGSLESSEGRARGEAVAPRISRNLAVYPWLAAKILLAGAGISIRDIFFSHSCTPVPFAAWFLFLLSRLQGRVVVGGRGGGVAGIWDNERSRLRLRERKVREQSYCTAALRHY